MHCEPADNFASVKEKAGKLMGIDPGEMGLFATRDKVRRLEEAFFYFRFRAFLNEEI